MSETVLVHERVVKDREEFMIVYLEDAKGLFGNLSTTATKLLALIWRDCAFSRAKGLYPGNTIELVKKVKQPWCDELNLNMGSVNNILSGMVKQGLLIEQASPIYILDPKRFFKGSFEHRQKALQVVYNYTVQEGL